MYRGPAGAARFRRHHGAKWWPQLSTARTPASMACRSGPANWRIAADQAVLSMARAGSHTATLSAPAEGVATHDRRPRRRPGAEPAPPRCVRRDPVAAFSGRYPPPAGPCDFAAACRVRIDPPHLATPDAGRRDRPAAHAPEALVASGADPCSIAASHSAIATPGARRAPPPGGLIKRSSSPRPPAGPVRAPLDEGASGAGRHKAPEPTHRFVRQADEAAAAVPSIRTLR